MDVVKAIINIKEGKIIFEGPQAFVEKYLDEYKSLIKQTIKKPRKFRTVSKR